MDNAGRFLVGGALGAALGYLLSQKNLGKTQQAGQVPTLEVEPPVTPAAEVSAPTVVIPPAPLAPSSGPEIMVTKEFLDEPLPSSGWTPSAPSTEEDVTAEIQIQEAPVTEIAPVPSDEPTLETGIAGMEATAETADAVESIPELETQSPAVSSRVDDLKSRIEETRQRIRRELEQPFDASSFADSIAHDWTTAPVVPAAETEVVPPAPLVPEAAETVAAETVAAEPTVTVPPKIDRTVNVESPALETPEVVIPPKPVQEPPAAVSPPLGSIEIESEAEPDAELIVTESEVELEVEPDAEPDAELLVDEPTVQEPIAPEPTVQEPIAPEIVTADAPADLDTAAEVDMATDVGQEEPAEPVDYESMRSRIESTRSRLKAKAFDAMMSGESALLGSDGDDSLEPLEDIPGVDDEIDKTIETSLSEEEE